MKEMLFVILMFLIVPLLFLYMFKIFDIHDDITYCKRQHCLELETMKECFRKCEDIYE